MIYQDDKLFIELEIAEIPWLKIFTNEPFKELSDLPSDLRAHLFSVGLCCERALREFYHPDKINWASLANYVPRVHLHIQARFKDDSFWPQSMWGQKQRQAQRRKLDISAFSEYLNQQLKSLSLKN